MFSPRFLHTVFGLFFIITAVSAHDIGFLKNGVTAHRGSSIAYPENTLTAISEGIRAHSDWVEVDIHRTKDGEIVICHDTDTKSVAEKNLVIANSTLAELRALDVAFQFRKSKQLALESCPAEQMPTLREALVLIQGQTQTRLSLQPKSDCVSEAITIIRELKAEAWVGFNEGALSRVMRVKELAPKIPVFWDRPARLDLERDLQLAKLLKLEAMVFHKSTITNELIQKVKAHGFEVGSYTVNEPKLMEQFVEWGIDRLYTDNPPLAKEIFEQAKK